ncbi:MAG: transcription termination factor NusA [Ardenticatenales bacterium]
MAVAAATTTKSELMTAVRGLSAARELPPEVILEALKAALRSAYDKIADRTASSVTVEISEATGQARVFGHFAVTEPEFIEDPLSQWTLEEALKVKPDARIGDTVTLEVTPKDFGRIAAQTAKQVILQRIREAEREQTYLTYADREGEIVYGVIQSANRDLITVALDRVEAVLTKAGQIPGERYLPNQRIRVYVSEVKRSPKGPQVIVSRTHKTMLAKLMELEIPEIFQGVVEIKAIAREAGSRSKVAVWSLQQGVDPVGACVGMRGVRIQTLVKELGGEKIDIVEWDPDPRIFIKHALSPAKVMHVWLSEGEEEGSPARGTANVVVPDDQLSLAIGREGQNARLGAKLTGWRIDIRAESEAGDLIARILADEEQRSRDRVSVASAAAEAVAAAASAAAKQRLAPDVVEPAAALVEAEAVVVAVPTDVEAAQDQAAAAKGAGATAVAAEAAPAVEIELPVALVETVKTVEPAVTPDDAVAQPVPADGPPSDLAPATPGVDGPAVAPTGDAEEEIDDDLLFETSSKKRNRGKRLVRDPKTGNLVVQRRRKESRASWKDEVDDRFAGEENIDDSMGFTEDDFLAAAEDEE